jgi:hypothetical protein
VDEKGDDRHEGSKPKRRAKKGAVGQIGEEIKPQIPANLAIHIPDTPFPRPVSLPEDDPKVSRLYQMNSVQHV